MPRSDWSISENLAIELEWYLERVRPRRILEVGSGFSTAVLAAYAERHEAKVVTLEHARTYHKPIKGALKKLGLGGRVDLRLARLRAQRFAEQGPYQWYDTTLKGSFDFVFVDGPPKVMGRQGVFFAVEAHLGPDWRMWLDDGLRKHESRCIRLWERRFPDRFSWTPLDIDGKGVFLLRGTEAGQGREAAHAMAPQLGIGVLGTGDDQWWRRVEWYVGGQFLDSSYVVVAAGDEPASLLPRFVDKSLPADGRSPQQRMRAVFDVLAERSEIRYVLYLDDRWSPQTLDDGWLWRALEVLEGQPEVQQVCLKQRTGPSEETMEPVFQRAFDFSPSLLRMKQVETMLPIEGGRNRRWLRLRPEPVPLPQLATMQLSPGVFCRSDNVAAG